MLESFDFFCSEVPKIQQCVSHVSYRYRYFGMMLRVHTDDTCIEVLGVKRGGMNYFVVHFDVLMSFSQ